MTARTAVEAQVPSAPSPAVAAGVAPPVRPARREGFPIALAAVTALVVVLVASGVSLGVYAGNLHNGLIAVAFTGVGVFVLLKRPGHREGRLFVAVGVAHAVMFFGRQYGLAALDGKAGSFPAADWVAWLGVWPLPFVLALSGVALMCFPDGHLPSARWRAVAVAMLALGAALSGAAALWPLAETATSLASPHPFRVGGQDAARTAWDVVGPSSYLAFQLAWVVCVLARLRRAEGDEARQLRWFAYAVALSALAMVAGLVVFGSPLLGVLCVPVVPVAAGLAIVKYRLYDIDVVIDKTLVVGAMAVLVTAGYVVVVVGVGALVGRPASSPLLPLLATALGGRRLRPRAPPRPTPSAPPRLRRSADALRGARPCALRAAGRRPPDRPVQQPGVDGRRRRRRLGGDALGGR